MPKNHLPEDTNPDTDRKPGTLNPGTPHPGTPNKNDATRAVHGKITEPQHPSHGNEPTRGSSIQGEKQNAKGAPQGANQGGAARGGSRVEPSHVQGQAKKDHN